MDDLSTRADTLGANRTPAAFLFDKQKALVYHEAIDENPGNPQVIQREQLRTAMAEMLQKK